MSTQATNLLAPGIQSIDLNGITQRHHLHGRRACRPPRAQRLAARLVRAGGQRSRVNPNFAMHPVNARFFDEGVGRCGAVIAGRRTYDVSDGWGGAGPMGHRPLFVVTSRPPDEVPLANPPYTFVTDGITAAVAAAKKAAGDQDVVPMGASMVRQCLRAGLLDELIISIVPALLGSGVRLLDDRDLDGIALEVVNVIDAPGVTHLTHRVRR